MSKKNIMVQEKLAGNKYKIDAVIKSSKACFCIREARLGLIKEYIIDKQNKRCP